VRAPAHVRPARRAAARWTRHRETRRARRTGELRQLRLLILHLTDGCNSRCVACDFRGPAGGEALTAERCVALAAEARAMGCGQVLLTGGEPLLRPDLPEILAGLRLAGLRITLLSNGLALRRHAELVARWCDEVVISLDGEDAAQYRATRGVDGLAALEAGVAALRAQAPGLPVRARVTVTACNAGHLQAIADRARAMGLSSLTDAHWRIIAFCRADQESQGEPPGLRRISDALGIHTRDLYKLFPKGPGKMAARIAGLRKPPSCI